MSPSFVARCRASVPASPDACARVVRATGRTIAASCRPHAVSMVLLAWGLSFVAIGAYAASPHAAAGRPAGPPAAAAPATEPHAAGSGLVSNGSFTGQADPLAFWSPGAGAQVTWLADGANGTQGAVQLRFVPTRVDRSAVRGAVYYTGLVQCVAIPAPGRFGLAAYGRVPATASTSSFASVRWTLRSNGPQCVGAGSGNGFNGIVRSTSWTASPVDVIEVDAGLWTPATTLQLAVDVGDSSTTTIEPVEAVLDEISLVELPLFDDGFDDSAAAAP